LEAPSDVGSKGYSCTCKDGYIGDGYFYPYLWYDECANEYPCAPPEEGGYCEDRAPDAAILPTKYACGCLEGFTPGSEFAKESHGLLSCVGFTECVATNSNGEPLHNCDSEHHGICTNTLGSFCGNIPYQDTLRVVTGYRHCRFVMMSHTQTAIDSKVDSLVVLLSIVDFSLRKIIFNYYKLSGRPKSFSSNDRSRLVSYDCIIHMVDPSHAETLTHGKSSELDLVTGGNTVPKQDV